MLWWVFMVLKTRYCLLCPHEEAETMRDEGWEGMG